MEIYETNYWRAIEQRLHEESLLHYPRNEMRKILRAYLNGALNTCEENVNMFFEQGFLLTCTGEFLDERGNEMGLPRKHGTVAKGTVEFSLPNPASSSLKIPRNTLIQSNMTSYEYVTSEDAYFDVGDTTATARVQGITYGKRYNAEIDELTIIDTTYLSSNLTVTNKIEIVGGTDGETDDVYRQRLFNSISTKLTVNYLKNQGNILYAEEEFNDNIRIKMTSLNPYMNNKYCIIPNGIHMQNFVTKEVIYNKIMNIYVRGW